MDIENKYAKFFSLISTVLKQILCISMVIIVVLPILLTLFASLKTKADMVTTSPLWLPPLNEITFENYKEVLTDKYLWIGFKNTTIILIVSVFFNVILGTMTAYIIERFDFKFKKVVVALFFIGMLIPSFVTEIARFKIINGIGLYNRLGAAIVIYIAADLMQIYIYRQFISTLPVSLDESALLDGCSYFRLFRSIIFPLLAPATATVVIIKSIVIINDMYIPYLYMPSNKLRTLTTFLMNFANAQQGSWQTLAAGIIVIMLPTILIYLFFQKYILAGVAAGAVKE
ncbi:MAG: carbohydrate ABC transporter permease [Lachnospirales bacterium]